MWISPDNIYASVVNNTVVHAGKIIGWGSDGYVCIYGCNGFPRDCLWVKKSTIKPYDEVDDSEMPAFKSPTEQSKRKFAKRVIKKLNKTVE